MHENLSCDYSILCLQVYKRNWKKASKEFAISLLIRFVENILLIAPMFFLYLKAIERHSLLQETIGPNNLEIKSIRMIWILLVGGATMIVLSIPLEIFGFWIYNHYGHPWKRFLSTDSLTDQRNNVDYPLKTIERNDKQQDSRSKDNATLNTYENSETDNLKTNDISEKTENNHLNKEENVEEEKLSLKTGDEVNPLDESYEILEKQLESLRLLKR